MPPGVGIEPLLHAREQVLIDDGLVFSRIDLEARQAALRTCRASRSFCHFNSPPKVLRLVVMFVRYPLSLRNVEDPQTERGIDICHETT